MQINTNPSAMNSQRHLSATQAHMTRSMESLSSGFRINRAADDAAGLVNSENLRGQIGGVTQAMRNAQDGISLLQVAEGALTEIQTSLQRMRDLAVEAANGTNDATALQANQDEIEALLFEIDRIASQTQFGTLDILDGSFEQTIETFSVDLGELTNELGVVDENGEPVSVDGTEVPNANFGDAEVQAVVDRNGDVVGVFISEGTESDTAGFLEKSTFFALNEPQSLADFRAGFDSLVAGDFGAGVTSGTGFIDPETSIDHVFATTGGLSLQVGANANQTIEVDIREMTTEGLGIVGGPDGTIDVSEDPNDAIARITEALTQVSSQRSGLGASNNRLDAALRNLQVANENLREAESRIRDTDIASEMVEFTRHQIMSQVGTSMLAQANQMPNSVLALLQ